VGPAQPDASRPEVWYNALPPYLSQVPYGKLTASGFDRTDPAATIWRDPIIEKMFGKTNEAFIFPYAMNRYLQPVLRQTAYAISDVQNPRSVVFLGESSSTDPGLLPGAVSYRFNRKVNSPTATTHVLFVDGHVAVTTREIFSKEPTTGPDEPLPEISWLPFPGAPAPMVE
jgi:prepilin-type processing-associated H-X9-DG protein